MRARLKRLSCISWGEELSSIFFYFFYKFLNSLINFTWKIFLLPKVCQLSDLLIDLLTRITNTLSWSWHWTWDWQFNLRFTKIQWVGCQNSEYILQVSLIVGFTSAVRRRITTSSSKFSSKWCLHNRILNFSFLTN